MNIKKQSNRSRVLNFIFRNQPTSRVSITEKTGITPAAVTVATTALLEEGVIREAGFIDEVEDNVAGRKRVSIEVVPEGGYALGVEFTEKNIIACITDLKGNIVDSISTIPSQSEILGINTTLITIIQTLINRNSQIKLIGVGIGVPGQIDHSRQTLITNSPIWKNFQLSQLQKAIGLPIVCENNVRTMATGQYYFNHGQTPESFAYFHVGRGMHCASIINGDLFTGSNYLAGEIGHTVVNLEGRRCECGKYGCLQTYASERWLLKFGGNLYESSASTLLHSLVSSTDEITIEAMLKAHQLGDAIIGGYFSDAIRYLGMSVSNIAITINPQKIFLHGEIFRSENLRTELIDCIQRQLLFVENEDAESIEIIRYQSTDGAVGASALAISRILIEDSAV